LRSTSDTIEVDAPIERVWLILTNLPAYGQWNRMIRWVRGDSADGALVEVRLRRFGKFRLKLKGRLAITDQEQTSHWNGQLWMRGLIDIESTTNLQALDEGRTRLLEVTRVSGLLEPFLGSTWTAAQYSLTESNRALKTRAEAGAGISAERGVAAPSSPIQH
jgi:hypothetical protein